MIHRMAEIDEQPKIYKNKRFFCNYMQKYEQN